MVQKRTLVQKPIPWKKSPNMFETDIYLQYSQTYMWVSASKHLSPRAHRRHSVHYITKCKKCFCFWGEPFQWQFPSRHLHRSLLCYALHRHCLCSSIFVLYFSSVSVLVPLYDFYVVSKKETYKLFTKLLMINPCVIEKYIVNVTYVVNDNQLGCFVFEKQTRRITVEFHKVTRVKPFINCLINCHTTLTWNKCKFLDTLSTIFPYISTKISRK